MRKNPNALCHSLDPKQTYYDLPAGENLSIADIAACWVFKRAKPRTSGTLLFAPVYELWPWRLFRYRGFMESENHWNKLKTSLSVEWDARKPIPIGFDANGVTIVHDGNHRLQIARELGYTHVPVRIEEFSYGYSSSPAGVRPYLQASAAAVHDRATWCDPHYFAVTLEKISSEKTSVEQGMTRDWAWLVQTVIDRCSRAERFGPQYERPRGWYQDPNFEYRQRKEAWQAYVEWVRLQKHYMELSGSTWPLKYVWPQVQTEDLFADLRALRGDKPEWLSAEDMTRWYAGRLYVDSAQIERYVKEKSEAELAQMSLEERSSRDRNIDEIMRLLGAKE